MTESDAHITQEGNSEALAAGSKLLSGQYEILEYLSSGGFGITYLARDSLNRTVVIKECFPEAFCSRVNKTVRARNRNYVDDFKSIVTLFIREAHALSRLDHPNVVGVHQVFEDNETAYMALDLVDGKDLLDIIQSNEPKLTPTEIRALTLDLLDAISHVHSQDLLHRDISPDNILLDKAGHPVLIDFGAAREEASRKSRVLSAVLVVKDGYSPQEFYVAGSQQSPSSDLYALAATLVHFISGEAPPNSQARLSALASNQPDLYVPLIGRVDGYDDAFLAAIDKTMNIVPADRLQSAEDWVLEIDHSKRVEMARAHAQRDETIDLKVMNLVRSVEKEGPVSGVRDAVPFVAAVAPPAPPVPKPVEVISQDEDCEGQKTARGADPKDGQATVERIQSVEDADKVSNDERTDDLIYTTMTADGTFLELDTEGRPIASTPYARIRSRALQAKQEKETAEPVVVDRHRFRRMATVPVIFCAYFFYGYTVLQYEPVQAATIQPLISLSEDFTDWKEAKPRNPVSIVGSGG